MRVLYVGGTGEISYACVLRSVALGHDVWVFNRGRSEEPLPPGTRSIVGDLADSVAYGRLADEHFDVVCQFKAYTLDDVARDIRVFAGHTAQYVYISSASAYEKPPTRQVLTEDIPLHNPFWPYSQSKADTEAMLLQAHADGRLPVTIVRPSHTYRRSIPGTFVGGDVHAWRMLSGRPVIIHGDGTSLWTLTHASDFAVPFVGLLGKPRALGEAFHITGDQAHTWTQIYTAVAQALGVTPGFVYVPTQTLVRYRADWAGPLWGDKAWSTLFDTSKLRGVAGNFTCRTPLAEGVRGAVEAFHVRAKSARIDQSLHDLLDQIAREQSALGL